VTALPRPRETGPVRLYLPSTLLALADPGGLHPTAAHAVTPGLRAALPDEDAEGLEFAAMLAAADASVLMIADLPAAPRRRVVVVAEVPGPPAVPRPGGLPSAVEPPAVVPWYAVVSLHVDEQDAVADVAAAAAGDEEAGDRAAERDLLWYDISELDEVRRLATTP
jgi:hypothetical protein